MALRLRADDAESALPYLAPSARGWQAGAMKHWAAVILLAILLAACSTDEPKACTPPRSTWGHPRSFGLVMLNRIALDRAGRIFWNGKQVSRQILSQYLALGPTMNPEPSVFLEAEMGVSCADLESVRDQIEEHVDCTTGYRCNEGLKTIWDNTPVPPDTPPS